MSLMAVCTCYIHIIPNVAVLYNYPPLSTPSHADLVPRIHLNFLAFAHIVRCHLLPEMAILPSSPYFLSQNSISCTGEFHLSEFLNEL